MFKNREIRIRVAKADDTTEQPVKADKQPTCEDVKNFANEMLKNLAIATVVILAAATVSTIVQGIAIHHGTKE